jgi:hypothetical protein
MSHLRHSGESFAEQCAALQTIVRAEPVLMAVLAGARDLKLADSWLVSGGVYNSVWNALTGRPSMTGVKDIDLFYFDASDVSYEAEDAVIRQAEKLFAGLPVPVEIRNQARVHLWYEEKFGVPYPPLSRATDGIDRFLMHNAQVGIRANATHETSATEVYAPRGFDDISHMIVRPNRTANFLPDKYREKALRWKEHWPELTILPA